jgi:hypothetical protein
MTGYTLAGYNQAKFIDSCDLEDVNLRLDPNSPEYRVFRISFAQTLSDKAKALRINSEKHYFPVKLRVGFAVGLYEVLFDRQSLFSYIIRLDKAAGINTAGNQCFFVRRI